MVADDPLASPSINPDSSAQLHFLAGRFTDSRVVDAHLVLSMLPATGTHVWTNRTGFYTFVRTLRVSCGPFSFDHRCRALTDLSPVSFQVMNPDKPAEWRCAAPVLLANSSSTHQAKYWAVCKCSGVTKRCDSE